MPPAGCKTSIHKGTSYQRIWLTLMINKRGRTGNTYISYSPDCRQWPASFVCFSSFSRWESKTRIGDDWHELEAGWSTVRNSICRIWVFLPSPCPLPTSVSTRTSLCDKYHEHKSKTAETLKQTCSLFICFLVLLERIQLFFLLLLSPTPRLRGRPLEFLTRNANSESLPISP